MIKRNQPWVLASDLAFVTVIISILSVLLTILNAYFSEPKSELEHIKLITDSDTRYYAKKDDCINLERKDCKRLNVQLYQGGRNERQ